MLRRAGGCPFSRNMASWPHLGGCVLGAYPRRMKNLSSARPDNCDADLYDGCSSSTIKIYVLVSLGDCAAWLGTIGVLKSYVHIIRLAGIPD